jgi:hypothetical protein
VEQGQVHNAYGGMGAVFLGIYALIGLLGGATLWALGRHIQTGA